MNVEFAGSSTEDQNMADLNQGLSSVPWGCPLCTNSLSTDLSCARCSFRGFLRDGLIYLHADDESWRLCTLERDGWIAYTKQLGLYVDNEDHFFLPDGRPHLQQFYAESKNHIDAFLRVEDLNGKICVDIGAGIGWVEPYILKRYPSAKLAAVEINDDVLCGLGRAPLLARAHGKDFYSVVADFHRLPFADNSVDVVFSVDALHHFRDLEKAFSEIHRVLSSDGVFYALNEPDRPEGTNESDYVGSAGLLETTLGIIERRPTLHEWLAAGKKLDLMSINSECGIVQHVDTASLIMRGFKKRE